MESEIMACVVTEASSSGSQEITVQELSSPGRLNPRPQLLLRKRKQLNSFVAPSNPYHLTHTYARRISRASEFPAKLDAVTQRVLSGKDHQIKQLQSDMRAAQNKICELLSENKLLQSLNKRNDVILNRFQNVEAELPTLLSHHNSEIKSLRERFQKLSIEHREQVREIRNKDAALQATKEQLVTLNKLVEDKGLKERQELARKLEEATDKISDLEQQHKTLSRQLILQKKSFKHQILREQKRYNDLQEELKIANMKISTLENKLKSKEKFITDHLTRKEFHQRQNFSSFKTLSLNSSDHKQKTSGSVIQKKAHASSICATPHTSILGIRENEDDELDSNLSFDQEPASSIMNHLTYTSSESDEDVSQIYKAVRPTSVPQLSLNKTVSTPWAVDSRTFSIRQTEYYGSQDNSLAHYSTPLNRQSTVIITPVPSSSDVHSKPVEDTSELDKDASEFAKNVRELVKNASDEGVKSNHVSDSGEPVIHISGEVDCVDNTPVQPKVEDVENTEENVSVDYPNEYDKPEAENNYSKEALLAALKAIDTQQNPEACNQIFPLAVVPDAVGIPDNHSDKKAELILELFGTQGSELTEVLSADGKSSVANS
jgi:hypothetical protein